MNGNPRRGSWRTAVGPGALGRYAVVLAALHFLAPAEPPVRAGVLCRQDCKDGPCAQAGCDLAGSGSGYSRCAGGAESWDGQTYSSWCAAWGEPPAASLAPAAVQEGGESAIAGPLATGISQSAAMTAALRAADPWVATLITALRDGTHWVDGRAHGLLHDSYFDAARGSLIHTAALAFEARATSTVLGEMQIDILVSGDLGQLSHIKRQVASTMPAAIPPREIHGQVTAGGLHGSLLVLGADTRQQTIRW
jgi:hypothetical protein